MKQVNALNLLASPDDTGRKTEIGGEVGHIYADGSVIVPATGAIWAPESTDGELWAMRKDFDAKHGITVSQRLTLPLIVQHGGAMSDRICGNYA